MKAAFIPEDVTTHCQRYHGCNGCPIKKQCANAQSKTTTAEAMYQMVSAAIKRNRAAA